jgi:hypothetical protein
VNLFVSALSNITGVFLTTEVCTQTDIHTKRTPGKDEGRDQSILSTR